MVNPAQALQHQIPHQLAQMLKFYRRLSGGFDLNQSVVDEQVCVCTAYTPSGRKQRPSDQVPLRKSLRPVICSSMAQASPTSASTRSRSIWNTAYRAGTVRGVHTAWAYVPASR